MAGALSTLTIRLQDDVSGPATKVAAALHRAEAEARAISKAIADSGASNRLGQSLARLGLSAGEIKKVGDAFKDYARSAGLAADATKWTAAQKAQIKTWESATINSLRAVQREQARLKADGGLLPALAPAVAAAKSRGQGRHGDTVAAVATGLALHAGKEKIKHGVEVYNKADNTLRYQGAMADLTDAERASRYQQGIKLGPQYGLSPTDIYKGQEKLAGRGVKKEFIEPFTQELVAYAKAMNTPIADAAKTLETIVFTTNQNVEDAATASQVMRKQIDIAVKAAKIGGLSNEDIQAGAKFGAGTAHGAGFKNETIFAILAALSRAGYHGDEGGVATRAVASRLVAPTRKGREAMQVAGIDYAKYTKHPEELGVDGLESLLQTRFGKKLNSDQRGRIEAILDDADIVNKPEEFTTQVSRVLSESFDKTKSGKDKAQDAQKIAKLAGDFLQKSTSSVDVEGLLTEILNKKLGIGLLNDLFSDKHGGKIKALSEKSDVFSEIVEALNHVKEGFASEIAGKRMEGVSGSLDRASASLEAFTLQVASANDGLIKFSTDAFSSVVKKLGEQPKEAIQTETVAGGALLGAGVVSAVSAYFGGAGFGASIAAGASTIAGLVASPAVIATAVAATAAYALANAPKTVEQAARDEDYRNSVLYGRKTTTNTLDQTPLAIRRANTDTSDLKAKAQAENDADDEEADKVYKAQKYGTKSGDAALEAQRGRGFAPLASEAPERSSASRPAGNAAGFRAGVDTAAEAGFDALKAKAAETGDAVKASLDVKAAPSFDPAAFSTMKTSAVETGAEMKTALSIVATPTVNTSSLEEALSLAHQLAATLGTISGRVTGLSGSLAGFRQRLNASFENHTGQE